MVRGVGTDIIEVNRIHNAIQKHGCKFLDRLFTQKEKDYCLNFRGSSRNFAGRFAAKEAIAKALGVGIGTQLHWTDIEILNDSRGMPIATLAPGVQKQIGAIQLILSISHCKEYATAVAIWL